MPRAAREYNFMRQTSSSQAGS